MWDQEKVLFKYEEISACVYADINDAVESIINNSASKKYLICSNK